MSKKSTSEMIKIMEEAYESQAKLLDFTKKIYKQLEEEEKYLLPLGKETNNPKYLSVIQSVKLTNDEKIEKLEKMRKDNEREFKHEFGILKDAKIIIEEIVLTERELPPDPFQMMDPSVKKYSTIITPKKYEETKQSQDEVLSNFALQLTKSKGKIEELVKFKHLLINAHPKAYELYVNKLASSNGTNKGTQEPKSEKKEDKTRKPAGKKSMKSCRCKK